VLGTRDCREAMNKLAQMVLEGKTADIKSGLSLSLSGFENLTVNGKYINGNGWIVITKDNMADYQF
jgi:simple sugar transport system substrate-binding protein